MHEKLIIYLKTFILLQKKKEASETCSIYIYTGFERFDCLHTYFYVVGSLVQIQFLVQKKNMPFSYLLQY